MHRFPLFLASAVLTLAATAHADITYTYTGQPFTSVSNSTPPGVPAAYTTSGFVTGSFTTASPLIGNLDGASILPTTFSFTDGVNTFSNTLASVSATFDISTNAVGTLTGWNISTLLDANYIFVEGGPGSFTAPGDSAFADQVGSASNNLSGTFTSNAPVPTPEPASLALFGTGLLGVVATLRRRLA